MKELRKRTNDSRISQGQAEAQSITASLTPTLNTSASSDDERMEEIEGSKGFDDSGEGESEREVESLAENDGSHYQALAQSDRGAASRGLSSHACTSGRAIVCPWEGCKKGFDHQSAVIEHLKIAGRHGGVK